MVLTFYDWVYGITQLAAGFLAIIGGFITISMLRESKGRELRAWRPLLISLLLFIVGQVVGGLRTFGILPSTGFWSFLVHILVSGILALMIAALLIQLQINRGWR